MIDFSKMTGPQLKDWYNKTHPARPLTCVFSTRAIGIKRCQARLDELNEMAGSDKAASGLHGAAPGTHGVAEKPAEEKAAPKKATASSKKTSVIRLVAKGNPYKDGSKGAEHFAAIHDGMPVKGYLDQFEKRKNASQWLGNFVAAGHVLIEAA